MINKPCSDCCVCATPATLIFTGCNGNPLEDVAWTVYDKHGDVVGTGTTGADGEANFLTTVYGEYTFDASKDRFDPIAGETAFVLTPPCPASFGPFTFPLTVATGYHCVTGCADPLPETLTLTDSVYGTTTLTWTGTRWNGSKTVTTSTCVGNPCAPQSGYVIGYTLTTGLVFGFSFKMDSTFDCPSNAGGPGSLQYSSPASITCPPTTNIAFDSSGGTVCAPIDCLAWGRLYCAASANPTMTVTE